MVERVDMDPRVAFIMNARVEVLPQDPGKDWYTARALLADRPYDGVSYGKTLHEIRCDGASREHAVQEAYVAMADYIAGQMKR